MNLSMTNLLVSNVEQSHWNVPCLINVVIQILCYVLLLLYLFEIVVAIATIPPNSLLPGGEKER
jgi:hypothetical protein